MTEKTGKVYLVGSGPGSINLMTIRAREVLSIADIILYDQLPGREIIDSLPETTEKIDVGKFGGHHIMKQSETEALMVEKAKEGKNVVRLKGGDPFVFGRGGEEMLTCRTNNIPVEVVPGITSAIAVPATVGIPVTHRGLSSDVTFITGNEDPDKKDSTIDYAWLSKSKGTIVILMGVKNLPVITSSLIKNEMDKDTPVAVIERGLRKDQRETLGTLENISILAKERGVKPPAIIIIGNVVSLYDKERIIS